MSRVSTQIRNHLEDEELLPVDLVIIQYLGCSDPTYTSKTVCEANGGDWIPDLRLTTHDTDLTVEIDEGVLNFEANDLLSALGDVEDTVDLTFGSIDMTISVVDQYWLDAFRSRSIVNKVVKIYRVLLDPITHEPYGKAFRYFSGYITNAQVDYKEGEQGSIAEMELSNSLYDFDKESGFYCNSTDYQRFHPEDTGFDNTVNTDYEIEWPKGKED